MKNVIVFMLLLAAFTTKAQVRMGQIAPEIALPDGKGKIISLSSLKGKVVLIDFWASWCAPCRIANRGLTKLYNKYKESGFEIYGVSTDTKKGEWLKAVKADNIFYGQVHDLDGVTAKLYGVEIIPTSILIDKKGNIFAIDAEGKELEDKIKQLLEK